MLNIRETAGRWDRAEGPTFFVASGIGRLECASYNRDLLVAVNELSGDASLETVRGWIDAGRNVFIDSGIFNLTMEHVAAHGCSMDEALGMAPEDIDGFGKLWDRYIEIVSAVGETCWGYIELDQGGRENKIQTRAKLEALGLRPIPVYHPINDGWDYFDHLASRYDRICLGNIVQANAATRVRILATIQQRRRQYPHLWIHMLGIKPVPFIMSVGTDSADASSWLWPVRWANWPGSAAMTNVGRMSQRYYYRYGSDVEDHDHADRLIPILGWDVACHSRMWRHHTRRVAEECAG